MTGVLAVKLVLHLATLCGSVTGTRGLIISSDPGVTVVRVTSGVVFTKLLDTATWLTSSSPSTFNFAETQVSNVVYIFIYIYFIMRFKRAIISRCYIDMPYDHKPVVYYIITTSFYKYHLQLVTFFLLG